MRLKTFVLLAALFFSNFIAFSQSHKILFIGNSMTYYNDMPKMFAKFAEVNNFPVENTVSAYPGWQIKLHFRYFDSENPESCKLLYNLDDFDFIILQEANLIIASDIQKLETKYLINALSVQCKPEKTKLTFQEPFTCGDEYPYLRRPVYIGDSVLEGDYLNTKEDELRHYQDFTKTLLNENICDVAKIGSCYYYLNNLYPNLNLTDEESHPTKLGSIIMAFIIFKNVGKSNFPDIPEEFKIYQKEIIATNKFLNLK
jgi:hypothetical protein